MANLFSQAITAFCVGTASGQYNDACNKAVDASTRELGVRQQVDSVEDNARALAFKTVQDNVNKEILNAVGATGFVYKTIKDKKINFNLPTLGLCSSINNEITSVSYRLTFQWRLK